MESHSVDINFIGIGNEKDFETLCSNLDKYYPEFTYDQDDMTLISDETWYACIFRGFFAGNINQCLKLMNKNYLCKNTNFDSVHVEIRVDGIWYN